MIDEVRYYRSQEEAAMGRCMAEALEELLCEWGVDSLSELAYAIEQKCSEKIQLSVRYETSNSDECFCRIKTAHGVDEITGMQLDSKAFVTALGFSGDRTSVVWIQLLLEDEQKIDDLVWQAISDVDSMCAARYMEDEIEGSELDDAKF